MPKSLYQINVELSLATASLADSAARFKAWVDNFSQSLTWQQAWDTQNLVTLQKWHKDNSGPRVPLTSTASGLQTITTQAEADALVGKTITGRVLLSANNLTLQNFKVISDGSGQAGVEIEGGRTGWTVQDIEVDGAGLLTPVAGIGGGTWANGTVRRAHIHHCLDGVRVFEGSTYENLYIHHPTYNPSYVSGTSSQHADGLQFTRGTKPIRVYKSWIDHGVSVSDAPNVTSAVIIKTDSSAISDVVVENCYINGGRYAVTIEAGTNGVPSNIAVRNNRFGRAYQQGLWSGAGVSDGVNYDRTGNTWVNDNTPLPLTWGFLGDGQSWVDTYS